MIELIKEYFLFCDNFFNFFWSFEILYNINLSLIIFYFFTYIFIWQCFILIFISFNEILFNYKFFLKDPNYIKYIKFLSETLYNFSYVLIKYYIKLQKKKKNYFFIFLRWSIFITPTYWAFLLFFFYFYFTFLNCVVLIRFATLNTKNLIIIYCCGCLEGLFLLLNPIFIKIYEYWNLRNRWGTFIFGRILYNDFWQKVWTTLYWNSIYFWLRFKKIYRFFRYKLFWLIYFKLFKKNLWIWRFKKLKWYLKTFFSSFKYLKVFYLNLKFKILNFKIKCYKLILYFLNKKL